MLKRTPNTQVIKTKARKMATTRDISKTLSLLGCEFSITGGADINTEADYNSRVVYISGTALPTWASLQTDLIEIVRTKKLAELDAFWNSRDASRTAGVSIADQGPATRTFNAATLNRNLYTMAIAALANGESLPASKSMLDATGTSYTVTTTEISSLLRAMTVMMFGEEQTYNTHKAAIQAETVLATLEAYDVTTGW